MFLEKKSDNDLMNDFAGCSTEAYSVIYNRYKDRVLNFILRSYLKDIDLSEDVVQQTFIKVYEHKYKYKAKYQFSTWVYTMARNQSIDFLRRMNKQEKIEVAEKFSTSSQLSEEIETDERNEILSNAIYSLSKQQREVIIMRYKQGFTYDEIAEITSEKVNTLKSHARRGLEKLKSILSETDYDSA